jgi:predicted permease
MAATVIVTLALAIGANGALFSLLDPLLFRAPSGVPDPGSLRRVYHASSRMEPNFKVGASFSYPEFLALRQELASEATVAIEQGYDSAEVATDAGTITTGVSYVSAGYFAMLGVRLERGRAFSADEDDVASPANVAVVGHFLAEQMGGSDDAIGKRVRLRGKEYVVIGVTASGFEGVRLGRTAAWVPFSGLPRETSSANQKPWWDRGDRYITLVARLHDVTKSVAVEARATDAYRRLLGERHFDTTSSIVLGPLSVARAPGMKDNGTLVARRTSVVAVLLLIIACANVSNLLLAAAVARRREVGVRIALGISRLRLLGFILLESIVLASAAGIAALLVAEWAGVLLRLRLMPRVPWFQAAVGPRVLVFTGCVTLVAAVMSAMLPAAIAWNASASDAFRSGTPRGLFRGRFVRFSLLAVQATLSLMLLAGAALFARTLQAARTTDLGYDRDRLVTTQVYYGDRGQRAQVAALMPIVAERVANMPGVEGVAVTVGAPMNQWTEVSLFRADADSAHPLEGVASYIGVSPNYFALTGTRVIDGRGFLPSDGANSTPAIVVGATMARKVWPGMRAVGQCLRLVAPSRACYLVVVVAADVHEFRIAENEAESQYYVPIEQLPIRSSDRTLVVRAQERDADAVSRNVAALLRRTFPGADTRAWTLNQFLQGEMRPWIVGFTLFGSMAGFALLVAIVGVYGAVAFEVRQRTREIGVRLALGAQAANVVTLLIRQNTRAVGLGALIGLLGALAAGRYLRALLYGVAPNDLVSLTVAAAMLLAAATVAATVPAMRAQRIDPAAVLRDD